MNCLNLSDIVTEVFLEFLPLTLQAKLIVWLKYVIAESTAETGEMMDIKYYTDKDKLPMLHNLRWH